MTVSSSNKMGGIIVICTCVLLLSHQQYVHGAPPIESCPHDSIQIEDTCKCDPTFCKKPICQYELNIAINGSDTPGSCCTIYSCDGCGNDTLLQDKCPCAPGAIFNSRGECKCVDPHKKLVNNECVCEPELCELPQICGANYVSVTEHDECCSRNKCIKCPEDSFATNLNDDAVEDKCVCYPCKNKECGANETVVIMEHGNDFPGSCCDIYKCESSCDVMFGDGGVWETPDGQKCNCQRGIAFCDKQNEDESFNLCHKEGRVYKHNESWMLDNCTNCTCFNGETKCIAHMCEVLEGHLKKPECQPLNCSKVCPDGYKLNKRGCQICKCNYPYKYDDILQKYNITKNQLKDIVDEYFIRNKTEPLTETNFITTTIATDNVSEEYHNVTPLDNSGARQTLYYVTWAVIGFIIGLALTIIITCAMRWCSKRKKGSYDTNPARSTIYERMNLTTGALFNNNYIGNDHKNEHNLKGTV
ncbi:cysteine-rich motor neuron 1 protein-like [Zophobas morio]|uniref:cysteine-rich motor neuron 1 protein-like n=1 Tax=Zophobas morio TaxID=2755281 RepID=UPI003083D822